MAEGITRSQLWCSCADTNIPLGVRVHLYGFALSAANLPWTKMLLQMKEWLLILCVYAQGSCKIETSNDVTFPHRHRSYSSNYCSSLNTNPVARSLFNLSFFSTRCL